MSSFDEVVIEKGSVTVTKERKPFPIPPQGPHNAECTEAEIKSFTGKNGDFLKVVLGWTLELKYKDDSGEDRNYMVFDGRPLSFGKGTKLTKAVTSLTGKPPVFTRKTEKRGGKVYSVEKFNHEQFIGMKCQLVVEHSIVGDRTYANVASYLCTPEQHAYNSQLVPKSEEDPAVPQDPVVAKRTVVEEAVPPTPETTVAPVNRGAKDFVLEKIAEYSGKKELEELKALLIDNTDLSNDNEVNAAYTSKLATLSS